MATVNWTTLSLENINDIAGFISNDSLKYAELFVEKIFERVKILENFPKSGRVVPEINNENIRELIFGNYRIVYKLYETYLDILTVHHSARLLSNSSLFDN